MSILCTPIRRRQAKIELAKIAIHCVRACVFVWTCSFSCGENWHDPVQCKWLKKWIKKCDDDSETSNWIAANTRVPSRLCLTELL